MTALAVTERPPFRPERVRVQRADGPAALAAMLGREYARADLCCQGGPQWMRLIQVGLHNVRLDRINSRVRGELIIGPLEDWHVGRLEAGWITLLTQGQSRVVGPGQMYLLGPGRRWHLKLEDPQVDLAVIRPALLSEAGAGAAAVLPTGPITAPADAAAQSWSRAFHHIRKTMAAEDAAPPPAMVVDALERLLVAATLALWPRPVDEVAIRRADRESQPETLRRAIAFIEASPAEDICIDDIADAACVSVRAVQLAFRRHLNTTPMAYLRQLRLACAHAELRTGEGGQTVGAVAKRWGFGNAGRFAAAYRAAYGQPPRVTLRNLRSPD